MQMEVRAANGRLQPGFRFHPTDVELIVHYLKRKVLGKRLEPEVIAVLDIYQFHPENLREKACWNEDLNWYFFCAKQRKYGSGERTNRATHSGFWKPTGRDRVVLYNQRAVGKVKTLVFHQGKSKPKQSERTDWVMYEYRLEDDVLANTGVAQDAYVLCKIFKKSGLGPRNGEQYGAPYIEEEWVEDETPSNPTMVPAAFDDQNATVLTDSAVLNGLESVDLCPLHASEQVYLGAVSLSAIDQAPTPTSDVANVALNSKGAVLDYDHAVDRAPIPHSKAADIASTSKGPNPDDDDIDALLRTFYADDDFEGIFHADDDFEGIYGNLEDLGIDLADLNTPLGPSS